MLDEIKQLLTTELSPAEFRINQDGSHFELLVVSNVFDGLNKLKRQQKIYTFLNPWIASGDMHAVTMHLHTDDEWQEINNRGF